MNWLFFILLALVVLSAVSGYQKGLIRTVVSMVSLILVLVLAGILNPHISGFICDNTQADEKLEAKCREFLENDIIKGTETSDAVVREDIIGNLPLPKSVQNRLWQSIDEKAASAFTDYLSENLAKLIINGITFLFSAILAIVVLKLVLCVVDLITELPVISLANRMGGLLLGVVRGVFWIWLLFLAVALFNSAGWAQFLAEAIQNDIVLTFLYNNNLLWKGILYAISGI